MTIKRLGNDEMRRALARARRYTEVGNTPDAVNSLLYVLDEIVLRFTLAELQQRANDAKEAKE